MSKIVSLFAPTAGAGKPVSGSSGKKGLKSNSLTKEEPLSPGESISGKPLRKKKKSFMDHLLFHGETLSPSAPIVSGPAKKEVSGKIDRSTPLLPDSPGRSPAMIPQTVSVKSPSLPYPSHVVKDSGGQIPNIPSVEAPGNPASFHDKLSDALKTAPISEALTAKKEGGLIKPVSEPGKKVISGSLGSATVQPSPSDLLSQTSVMGEGQIPEKAPKTLPGEPFSHRKPSFPSAPSSPQTTSADGAGDKISGDGIRLKSPLLQRDLSGTQMADSGEVPPKTAFEDKPIKRDSPLLPESKIVSPSRGESSVSDGGEKGKGASGEFSPDMSKSPDGKVDQSGPSAGPVSAALPLTVPDTLPPTVSDRPAIDQRELLSRVITTARHGGGEISLRVHPPALGPIRIQVHVDPRTREVEVRLFAKDETVGDLLRSKSQDLKGALSKEGFTMHQFHVEGGDLPGSSLQVASSGFSPGGDASSGQPQGSSQGNGAFLASGPGGGAPGFTQGGDSSRERSTQARDAGPGIPAPEETSFHQPSERLSPADLSGFHRVV
ncbi:MAG: flagellar hook-length control protein FliK [Leptospirillum sp.]|jgi:hypothetical protein